MDEGIMFDKQDRAVMAWMVGFAIAKGACRFINKDALQQLLDHLSIDVKLEDMTEALEEVKT